MKQPIAIYIHWPWCKAKCPYCDFNSHASAIQEDVYIAGLLHEITMWRNGRLLAGKRIPAFEPETRKIESVFFGGGTPSLMAPANLKKVIDACHELGEIDASAEITVECNPTSFDDARKAEDFFVGLKAAGVNRVSIGVQGLRPEWLAFLGRTHKVEDALATLDAALKVFDNVNADVIYGLPGQQIEDWVQQLQNLTERGLNHISAYQLTIEPNTHFYSDVRKGLWEPISVDLEADFFDATRTTLLAAGYENYEISNFAKPGKACRHNVHVWKYGEYLAIGAGAHGRVLTDENEVVAMQVVRQPEGYLRRAKDLSDTVSQAATLNASEAVQEAIFSGLRLLEGADVETIVKRFKRSVYEEAISVPETLSLTDAGLLADDGRTLRLTEEGWPKLNGILRRILTSLPRATPEIEAQETPASTAYKTGLSVTIL